uniref:Uncharacterized protein n=1 Tax=Glossina austeni TaxID=7395 RepID=A0A1A9UES9_GLOAU
MTKLRTQIDSTSKFEKKNKVTFIKRGTNTYSRSLLNNLSMEKSAHAKYILLSKKTLEHTSLPWHHRKSRLMQRMPNRAYLCLFYSNNLVLMIALLIKPFYNLRYNASAHSSSHSYKDGCFLVDLASSSIKGIV